MKWHLQKALACLFWVLLCSFKAGALEWNVHGVFLLARLFNLIGNTDGVQLCMMLQARQRIDTVVERFVSRVGQHFSNLVASVADDANKEWMRQSEREWRSYIDSGSQMHSVARRHLYVVLLEELAGCARLRKCSS